jgi:hypothetical protein
MTEQKELLSHPSRFLESVIETMLKIMNWIAPDGAKRLLIPTIVSTRNPKSDSTEPNAILSFEINSRNFAQVCRRLNAWKRNVFGHSRTDTEKLTA